MLLASINLTGFAILPLVVFVAETCVVTLSTVRTILVARGVKGLAALLGFFEVSIWLFAIAQVMQNLQSPACALAFALGFSLGNWLGVILEGRLALGNVEIQVTTRKDPEPLIEALRWAGYGVTRVEAWGTTGPASVVFTIVRRRFLRDVLPLIHAFDRQAFYVINT